MYDTNVPESFRPQMLGEARCGPRSGARLERLPVVEMTMGGWKSLHPGSRMVGAPGSPYGSPPRAFPFSAMASPGDHAALEFTCQGSPALINWDGTREAASGDASALNRFAHLFTL